MTERVFDRALIGGVTADLGKAADRPVGPLDSTHHAIDPETRAILAFVPTAIWRPAVLGRGVNLLLHFAFSFVFLDKYERAVAADCFLRGPAEDLLRACAPVGNL